MYTAVKKLMPGELPCLLSPLTRNTFQRSLPPLWSCIVQSPTVESFSTSNTKHSLGTTYNGGYSIRYIAHSKNWPRSVKVSLSLCALYSSGSETKPKEKILALKTISELLDFCQTSRVPLDLSNRVDVLHTIATVVWKDADQRIEQQKHREASRKGYSVFRDLLNHLAADITNLDTKKKNEIRWSLDKIQEFKLSLFISNG